MKGSAIDPLVLEQYFKSSGVIMNEVYKELRKIIGLVEINMERYRKDAVLGILLENLRKQPLMLKVLIEANDDTFFENNTKNILLYITVPERWGEQDSIWEETYKVFCFEFLMVLKWWADSDFSEEKSKEAISRINAWLIIDSDYRSELELIELDS